MSGFNYNTSVPLEIQTTDKDGNYQTKMTIASPTGDVAGEITVKAPAKAQTTLAHEEANAASPAPAAAAAPEDPSANYRYVPEPLQADPVKINEQIVASVTPALENQPAALSALRSANALSRLSRDEYSFSSSRIANIAGYCTYLKDAASENGLYASRIRDAKTA